MSRIDKFKKKIKESLNTCIILVGVGRIYSIQGEVVKKRGRDILKIQGGVG